MCADRKANITVKVLKVLGWTFLTIVVVLSALLFCAVKFLESKELSPWVERTANEYIDGHLKVGSLRLGFHPRFPILGVKVENLSVISHAFDSLTVEQRGLLPNYADSLVTLDHLSGSLDVKRLIMDKELALQNVVLRGLSVNLVIAHNGKANYDLVKASTDTVKSPKKELPKFRINRFALEQPKEIRFYNAADSTSAAVLLLTDAAVDGDKMPTYRLKVNGNVTSPKATLITNLDQISFGLNGKVFWDPGYPGLVAMDEMELRGAFIKAVVTGEIDLKDSPIVKKAIVDLAPIPLVDILTLLPDSIRRVHRLYEPYFSTDLTIGGKFELTEPMNLATDTFPTAQLKLSIPPSNLHYEKAQFKDIALDVIVNTLTNLPDSTVVNVSRCTLAGPATHLEVSAILSKLFSDPTFDTKLQGEINLSNLPPIIREKIPGYLSGSILTDLHANGKTSLLKQERIHRLVADGSVTAQNIYFLSGDTNKMVEVNKARIDFDSKRIVDSLPILSAKVDVDTANLLIGGVDIAVGSLSLGLGLENAVQHIDTTEMMPLGGDLKVSRLNIISITDSAGGRIRNLDGHITLQGLKAHDPIPEILADLHTGRVSAGSLSDRILLNDTKIKATLYKQPTTSKKSATTRPTVKTRKEYPYIAPAKVFKYVYKKRHRKPGQKRKRRVYGTIGADDNEVLEWDLAKGFSKFLNEWELNGSVITTHARLLTPIFPLHNRFSLIDLKFNNDTVDISNIALRTGRSNIALSGLVTNVKRALTSKTNNTLKVNLSLLSDTIDINQLSAGVFTGASYADHKRHGDFHLEGTDDDATLQARLDDLAKKGPGKAAPVLIPVNVEGNLRITANNVLYSDLALQNFGGDILVYDGGVNLHQMKANSDAGNLIVSALYSAPKPENMHFGFGLELEDFNIGKFVKLVPAVDSIMPLIHDFSGTVSADIAATCDIDSGMNLDLPTLNAAIRITGDNLAFINPETYRTLGKWLGFKNKADNTIKRMNVEMTVDDGIMHVYPFVFNIDRYRLGISGSNDIAMNFNYHISVLKSPLPFKFGINISGNPKKYKVRFGGAKFKEDTAIESVSVVNNARINLLDQIENVFRRGVQNSRFAKLQVQHPAGYASLT
ncbi:MAG: AsmA-like C-terminal region-containing protein, partial [Muribaculaceae bacterium]|nr:AsmA-like C-terminal region-containing protein [Muribaculaceae bacterium]